MQTNTVIRHARKLHEWAVDAQTADLVPDHVPDFDHVTVADLPSFTLAKIAVWAQAGRLHAAYTIWIEERSLV